MTCDCLSLSILDSRLCVCLCMLYVYSFLYIYVCVCVCVRACLSQAVVLRSEHLSPVFTLPFLRSLFEENSQGLFDVRTVELGHLQNGGPPTAQVPARSLLLSFYSHSPPPSFLSLAH